MRDRVIREDIRYAHVTIACIESAPPPGAILKSLVFCIVISIPCFKHFMFIEIHAGTNAKLFTLWNPLHSTNGICCINTQVQECGIKELISLRGFAAEIPLGNWSHEEMTAQKPCHEIAVLSDNHVFLLHQLRLV